MFLFFCTIQQFHSQEGGTAALELPVRNALRFNRYAISPTFSFVREQNRFISFTNKRQWVRFDDAPQTNLFSYSGRFRENIGAGVAAFQQDYGILTTFGGIINFAYNTVIGRESNLTFGLNLGFYKSSVNEGRVVTNFPAPSLKNIPSSSVITINPGINYGTGFFDFGVSINNLASYNLTTSRMIEENPEQAVQGHVMYTGYMDSGGFFDESKFSALARSEFKKDETVFSGVAMLTIPKGIWAQVGYNSKYGFSGGLGLNVSKQISLEYNYEMAMGDFSNFGNSHEISLAYKFKKNYRFNYSDGDEETALFVPNKRKANIARRKAASKSDAEFRANRIAKVKKAQLVAEAKAKTEKTSQLKSEIQEENRDAANANLATELNLEAKQIAEEARAKEAKLARLKRAEQLKAAGIKAQKEAEAQAKIEKAEKQRAEMTSRLKEEQEAKLTLEAQAKLEAERAKVKQIAKVKAKSEEAAKLERTNAEQEAKEKVEAKRLRLETEARTKSAEVARLKRVEQLKAIDIKAQEEAKAEQVAEAQAKKKKAERQRAEMASRLKAQQEAKPTLEAQAKLEAKRAKVKQIAKVKAKAEELARLERANAEQEAKVKSTEAARLKRTEQLKAAEIKAQREAEAQNKLEAERAKAREAARIAEAKVEKEPNENQERKVLNANKSKAEIGMDINSNNKALEIPDATDATARSMQNITQASEKAKKVQQELLTQLSEKVAIKQQDLDDLKKENDLSEQGIFQAPKKFKSITAENNEIEALKDEIDKIEKEQKIKIIELETLYITRRKKVKSNSDPINAFYLKAIAQLKSEQTKIRVSKEAVIAELKVIKLATDVERKRRIKRAAYDNESDRYQKDSAALVRIKRFTDTVDHALTEDDFDFGEEQNNNIRIVKNILNAKAGYYLVIAAHNDVSKRDEFVTKMVSLGQKDVDFFFDVTTNKYYIYQKKYDNINQAKQAMASKEDQPFNKRMSLVKIEN